MANWEKAYRHSVPASVKTIKLLDSWTAIKDNDMLKVGCWTAVTAAQDDCVLMALRYVLRLSFAMVVLNWASLHGNDFGTSDPLHSHLESRWWVLRWSSNGWNSVITTVASCGFSLSHAICLLADLPLINKIWSSPTKPPGPRRISIRSAFSHCHMWTRERCQYVAARNRVSCRLKYFSKTNKGYRLMENQRPRLTQNKRSMFVCRMDNPCCPHTPVCPKIFSNFL